jgi:hypothetical protein
MTTFLSFIGILAILLLIKFLFDTFVKGERYSSDGKPLPSEDILESTIILQEILSSKKNEYFDKLITYKYSINELRNLQKKWSEKKFQEAKEKSINVEDTYAFYAEIWTREFIDEEHLKKNPENDQLKEYSKREFENALKRSVKNKNYIDASVFTISYENTFPEEEDRLKRCRKELSLLIDGEDLPENLYYFKDEGITKIDFENSKYK